MSTPVTAEEAGIRIPDCPNGIGRLIVSPESPEIIDGVRALPYTVWPDDRGYFLEVLRATQGLAAAFPLETTQVSAALSYPGTIKACHFHQHQTDLWVPAMGMFQVALVDLRPNSPTFGAKNTFYVGAHRPWQILIPPGVGHGYKIIGRDAAMLVYVTNRFYNPKDEGRIPYDQPQIGYDWETQHK